jgi:RNA polymerase sigma-70 factor (ECF subfamily)
MDDFDERELVARCQRGDDSAFAELVDRYKNLVYAMIYRMMTERTQVEDLAQDVFLKVHRGLPYFRGEARLSTWIYRIVANVCVQARNTRRQMTSSTDVAEPASADGAFAELELRDRIEKAMAKLPDNYRFLIAAHYLRGVQYEALAESLNIPLGTVKTHLFRAKRQLRELMS